MMQHDRSVGGRIVQQYEVDTLGAPFKVTIHGCVALSSDPVTGEETVKIPDLVGLVKAVVRARVCHDRKLNGAELKFVRNALGLRAKDLAQFLDMTAEHLSRCEAGVKVMSRNTEMSLRLVAFIGSYLKEPSILFDVKAANAANITPSEELEEKKSKATKKFIDMFLSMKIQSVFDPDDELHFEFCRRPREPRDLSAFDDDCEDNGEWQDENDSLAA